MPVSHMTTQAYFFPALNRNRLHLFNEAVTDCVRV